jgi:hypothetical protein
MMARVSAFALLAVTITVRNHAEALVVSPVIPRRVRNAAAPGERREPVEKRRWSSGRPIVSAATNAATICHVRLLGDPVGGARRTRKQRRDLDQQNIQPSPFRSPLQFILTAR